MKLFILRPIVLLFFLLLGVLACPGEMGSSPLKRDAKVVKKDRGIKRDRRSSADIFQSSSDTYWPIDGLGRSDSTGINPGDPCVNGQCGNDLICTGNVCLKKCKVSTPDCNQQVDPCGPNESCGPATSFTDACYPTTLKVSDLCENDICPPGTMCIGHYGPPFKCYTTCPDKTTCPTGFKCGGISTSGCYYCIP